MERKTKKKNYDKNNEKDLELTKEIDEAILDITKDMEAFRFYMAGEKIYAYTWSRFADVIIEESKIIILNNYKYNQQISYILCY